MIYQNPILRGFYPDPSVCYGNGHFYMVCSSFQFFPGVPLFESDDLVNWKQVGHVLTRHSQVMLDKVRSSGGVFAPTIRYHEGRFYMVTNNNSTNENFYVYTDDIYGEWSDPVTVDQDGIDPSLLFDAGHVYFLSNGTDDENKNGIVQCEIDITTGAKLSPSKCLWPGTGGRYLESPHMYKIGDYYYLMAAEGGTEYGHMVTYARSKNAWGPFEDYAFNPVLTNRNKAPGIIQGIGHGDLIQNTDGSWYIVTLGFRQIQLWQPYHHLGREVFLTPVSFSPDNWFTCGDGTTNASYEIPGAFSQERKELYTFENTDWNKDWCYLRKYNPDNYHPEKNRIILHGSNISLEDADSPTFIGIRQLDFHMHLTVDVLLQFSGATRSTFASCPEPERNVSASCPKLKRNDAGITLYMCEKEHYDLLIRPKTNTDAASAIHATKEPEYEAVLRLCIGDIKHEQKIVPLSGNHCTLKISSEPEWYSFHVVDDDREIFLGKAQSKYLSSEVSDGFTGVVIGLFAEGNVTAQFEDYCCKYN